VWELGANEVHCWFFTHDRFRATELATVLCPDERDRVAQFPFHRERIEYVVCRGVLRQLLARYGAGSASDLQFEYTARGKPELPADRNAESLHFSVAHSGGAAVIGVTRRRPVGVDVECVRPVANLAALVRTCFAAEEQSEFWRLPEWIRSRALYTGWTRKEAFVKARGEGLSRPLGSFAMTIAPDVAPRLLRVDDDWGVGKKWKVVDLTSNPMIAAAVAIPEAGAHILTRELYPQMLGEKNATPRDRLSALGAR
jgi:4'-phosphopantetheinyl transferase